MKQDESLLLREPFRRMLSLRDWYTVVITGGLFQSGLPDVIAMHPTWGVKFIEFKIIRNGSIHFTQAQKVQFPILYAHGMPIYIICYHQSIEGIDAQVINDRERLYNKLFEEPNVVNMFHPSTIKLLF